MTRRFREWLLACMLISGTAAAAPAAPDQLTAAKVVATPPTIGLNLFYASNGPALAPSPLVKLPIGSIVPRGWLRHQLELEAQGMTGHLEELSHWCKFEGNAWADPNGRGENGWEELPYWLKGYGDLGYVLQDPTIIQHARRWIDAVLASQEADGYFGPRANKTGLNGEPDLWPHMVMCNVLQSYYDYSGDGRVLTFLTNYYHWIGTQADSTFSNGRWPHVRAGDAIETAYWLYNRTGDPRLLEIAKTIHDHMARWDRGIIDEHNVNIAQGFREPAIYYLQVKEPGLRDQAERNYREIMDTGGQFSGGGFAADENRRPGFTDPRQGFETCGIVEFMHSFELLTKITGDPRWADRTEEIAFNSLPAAMTPDLRGLHYLTCPNQVQLDRGNKSPGIQNPANMFAYSAGEYYRCCQHNVSHGWPYYAEELWLATLDGGLCADLYSASEVTAKVGDGTSVRIVEDTDYPFGDTVTLRIAAAQRVKFPLYLRIPGWCTGAAVKVNGEAVPVKAGPLSYVALERWWRKDDVVTLTLPMAVAVRRWEKNQDSVSVNYGPLEFSLRIGECWSRYGGTDRWPDNEVFPTTAWNYGLLLDEQAPAAAFEVRRRPGPVSGQPFALETAPIELRVNARKIPNWRQDWQGLVSPLQPSPVASAEPIERVTLIPMGAARLRITSFPVIGDRANAHGWNLPPAAPITASHCFGGDTVAALVDGKLPKDSRDKSLPRFTWRDHAGTKEWVQYEFDTPRNVTAVSVYWVDDSGRGRCRVPESWKILYKSGAEWKEVEGASGYGTTPDAFNRTPFRAVWATALRLEAKLQPGFSGGILEWRIIDKIED